MKVIASVLLLFGNVAVAQELPQNLTLAVKENKSKFPSLELEPELSYYSKNYYDIFRMNNYTFNTFDYGARNVYEVDFSYRNFDEDTPHIFKVMPLPGVNVDAFMAQPCNAGYTIPNQ